MIKYKNYEEGDFEIIYEYLLDYYKENKLSSPFLPCNYVWGYILSNGEEFSKQVLIYDDNFLIGLITFDSRPGENFIFLNKGYEYLMDNCLDYCEKNLYDKKGELSYRFNELNVDFKNKLIEKGYELLWEDYDTYIKTSDDFPRYELPDGYRLIHLDDDEYDRRKADISGYLGFDNPIEVIEKIDSELIDKSLHINHYDRHEKVSIIDEENNYCCNAHFWIDSDYCVIEPLSTHPAYRGKGLARYMLRYGYELAKKNNCYFFRGGPMEYYIKAKMNFFKGFHYGKKGLNK